MKRILYISLGLLLLLASACQPLEKRDHSDPPIAPEVMVDFLYDFHLTEAFFSQRFINSEKNTYLGYVFKKHGVTPQEIEEALIWYNNHYDVYMKVYDEILRRYDKELAKIETNIYDYYLPLWPSIWTYYGAFPKEDSLVRYVDFAPYLELPAPKLRTNDSRRYPYVERFRRTAPYWEVGNE